LCFGREFWIDAQGTEEIQSGGGLFDESTPQMEREIWICAAQNGNEVIFPGGNCTFCCIPTVDMRRDKLKGHAALCHEILDLSWGFVVQNAVDRF
jgi:hypothetical protein